MPQNSKIIFIHLISPLLYFGKIFGTVFFKITPSRNKIVIFLESTLCLPLICCFFRWSFVSITSRSDIRYINRNNTSIIVDAYEDILTSLSMLLRYLVYFVYHKRFKTLLNRIGKLNEDAHLYQSKWLNVKKILSIEVTVIISRIIMEEMLLATSSVSPGTVENALYHVLNYVLMYADIFYIKAYFDALHILFLHINEEIASADNISDEFFRNLRDNHGRLCRIIIGNQHILNTSILPSFLMILIAFVNSSAYAVCSTKAYICKETVDPVLLVWEVLASLELVLVIWVIIEIRMKVVNEVSDSILRGDLFKFFFSYQTNHCYFTLQLVTNPL